MISTPPPIANRQKDKEREKLKSRTVSHHSNVTHCGTPLCGQFGFDRCNEFAAHVIAQHLSLLVRSMGQNWH